MGLLDDAIREHMELKRLRGADPTVIAQQEHDALGPVLREEDVAPHASEGDPSERADPTPAESALPDEDSSELQQPADDPDFANVGQETAELDMRTVLEEEPEREEEGKPEEDVLEETPDFLRDTPEQERLWFEQQPPRDFDFDK